MFKKNSFVKTVVIVIVTLFALSSPVLAEMKVSENPAWPENELGAKPEFKELEGKDISLDIWHSSRSQIKYIRTFAKEFEKLYPEINLSLKIQELPANQRRDSLSTSLIAGSGAPDITALNIIQASKFLMEPYINQFKTINLNEELADNLIKKQAYTRDGKLKAVESAGPHPVFLVYRKDLFKEAGIQMPLETWDEFIAAGKKMKSELDIPITLFPIQNIGAGEAWYNNTFAVQNGNSINKDGEFNLNNEKGIEAYKLIKDMIYKHDIAVDASIDNPLTHQRLIGQHEDQIASMIAPLWFAGSRLFNKIDEPKFGLAPLPKFPNSPHKVSVAGGTGLAIIESQSDYPELAEAFVKYTLTEKNQIRKFKETNYLPVVKSALRSEEVRSYKVPSVYGDQPIGEMYAEYVTKMPDIDYSAPNYASVMAEMNNRINELPKTPVEDWLQMIEDYYYNQVRE